MEGEEGKKNNRVSMWTRRRMNRDDARMRRRRGSEGRGRKKCEEKGGKVRE